MFVTFEGIDGSGKSSLLRALAERLAKTGREIVLTKEPGATSFGAEIRRILLDSPQLNERSEIYLFMADRANHVDTVIRPNLARGAIVLCDRYADSSTAYQGYGREYDPNWIRTLNDFATDKLKPDLTFLLDIDPETALKRQLLVDRLGSLPVEFYAKVRSGFLHEASLEPSRWTILDASLPQQQLVEAAWEVLSNQLGFRGES